MILEDTGSRHSCFLGQAPIVSLAEFAPATSPLRSASTPICPSDAILMTLLTRIRNALPLERGDAHLFRVFRVHLFRRQHLVGGVLPRALDCWTIDKFDCPFSPRLARRRRSCTSVSCRCQRPIAVRVVPAM